jgi:hypothetical protein
MVSKSIRVNFRLAIVESKVSPNTRAFSAGIKIAVVSDAYAAVCIGAKQRSLSGEFPI